MTEPKISAPTVVVRDAELAFGGVRVFQHLNLMLPAGRTTCLLGPSGVGKSSLLRLMAGLSDIARGSVRLRTADGREIRPSGQISYMAQQDLLLPWLSALDNVLIGCRLRGQRVGTAERARATELLAAVGLAEARGRRPAALSGGMRQRVSLARTLYEDRPVVLMDEPFSALDAVTRHQLQALAARLLAHRTVLLVTHDPQEALRLAEHMLLLRGRPAGLVELTVPEGAPPRAAGDPTLARAQEALLSELAGETAA